MFYDQLSSFTGIPTLVLLKRDGEVITNNGRAAIGNDPEGKVKKLCGILVLYTRKGSYLSYASYLGSGILLEP